MTQDEIIELAIQGHASTRDAIRWAMNQEREVIAQMFENAPSLVPYAMNDQGGCLMCGFTPAQAIKTIRTRGQA
jgi:hypothetical protein